MELAQTWKDLEQANLQMKAASTTAAATPPSVRERAQDAPLMAMRAAFEERTKASRAQEAHQDNKSFWQRWMNSTLGIMCCRDHHKPTHVGSGQVPRPPTRMPCTTSQHGEASA